MRFDPPYRLALAVAALVLAGYVFSLAPSVTFWDAGEFIAAMKILGIPHPPGTPLFVLMGHVWAMLVPGAEFAWRTNLMSATFSAGAAGFWFLVVHETLLRVLPGDERGRARLRLLGAGGHPARRLHLHQLAEFQRDRGLCRRLVHRGGHPWACLRWRAARGTERSRRPLLMIAYLLGLSIANHLLALLVGPAVIAFLIAELRLHPAATPEERRGEWARAAVFAGLWALLLGVGLGSPALAAVGGVAFLAASAFAVSAGTLGFAVLALAVALVGVTPYLFLFLRSGQQPVLNEAAPSTWDALLAVIQRAQYPVRTPSTIPPSSTDRTIRAGASPSSGSSSSTTSSTSIGSGPSRWPRRSPGSRFGCSPPSLSSRSDCMAPGFTAGPTAPAGGSSLPSGWSPAWAWWPT